MNGANRATILGTVCRTPETKATANGMMVCNLTLVTSYQPKGKEEQAEFHRIVMFGRLAEIAGQYLDKGSIIYIEGRIQTRSWEKEGIKRYSTEIVAHELQMVGGRGREGSEEVPARSTTAPPAASDDFTDPIPF